jgi:hypothetical protein
MRYTREQLSSLPVFCAPAAIPIEVDGRFLRPVVLDAGDQWVQYDATQGFYRCGPKSKDLSAEPYSPWHRAHSLDISALRLKPLEELFVHGLLEVLGQIRAPLRIMSLVRGVREYRFWEPCDGRRFLLMTRPNLALRLIDPDLGFDAGVVLACGDDPEPNHTIHWPVYPFSTAELELDPEACTTLAIQFLEHQLRNAQRMAPAT